MDVYGNCFQQALTHSVLRTILRELPLKSTSVKFWAEMRFEIVHMNEEQHKRAVWQVSPLCFILLTA